MVQNSTAEKMATVRAAPNPASVASESAAVSPTVVQSTLTTQKMGVTFGTLFPSLRLRPQQPSRVRGTKLQHASRACAALPAAPPAAAAAAADASPAAAGALAEFLYPARCRQ